MKLLEVDMGHISDKSIAKLKSIYGQAQIDAKSNTDEQALNVKVLYPDWSSDYAEGDTLTFDERVNYNDTLYKVLQTHQKQKIWNPSDSPSLFAEVLITDPSTIPAWVQPDSTNSYMKGDKVTHNGATWESLVDNNVWEPGAVGSETVWEEVSL